MMPVLVPPRPFLYHFGYGSQQQEQQQLPLFNGENSRTTIDTQIGLMLKKLLFDAHQLRSIAKDPEALARSIDYRVNQLPFKEKMDAVSEFYSMVDSPELLAEDFLRSGKNNKGNNQIN